MTGTFPCDHIVQPLPDCGSVMFVFKLTLVRSSTGTPITLRPRPVTSGSLVVLNSPNIGTCFYTAGPGRTCKLHTQIGQPRDLNPGPLFCEAIGQTITPPGYLIWPRDFGKFIIIIYSNLLLNVIVNNSVCSRLEQTLCTTPLGLCSKNRFSDSESILNQMIQNRFMNPKIDFFDLQSNYINVE